MGELIDRLLSFGTPEGPSPEEVLEVLAQLRSTPDEGRGIERLVARMATGALPDSILVAVASALVDRGELTAAATLLERSTSSAALIMRADLLEDAGDRSAALSLVEQVLGRDIDWPGARERRARWGASFAASRGRAWVESTLLVPPTIAAGPYFVVREAGRGGSATVYEAEDPDLGRRVAVKVYHRPDRDRAKLLHEARVAVAVAGEGVVPIFDVDPGAGWLAMQWAANGALPSLSEQGHHLRWAEPLARALARVHAAGWVHYDLKPANVLLRAPDAPMLADFGIARRAGEPAPPGSLGYVSPERQAGQASDPSEDVYGFGCVLRRALGGGHGGGHGDDAWRALAAECTAPAGIRPANASALVDKIAALKRSAERR